MAATLPAKLRTADIQRFAVRSAQLAKYRPIVTYWCDYYILQQVLTKQLHTTDEECSTYAIELMDKLESTKSENATNDAIEDDVAAKAYIENFAQDTFNRADEAQRANKVTKQTADTFMAAATFFDLVSIWGEVEKETAAKSKFAKYHAARILKAFKKGEDPNESNPAVEEEQQAATGEEDLEAEMRAMERGQEGKQYQQPTVESMPDGEMPPRPSSVPQGASAPPIAMSPAKETDDAEDAVTALPGSTGGGYFPTVPSALSQEVDMSDLGRPSAPTPIDMNPTDFYNTNAVPPPAAIDTPGSLGISESSRPGRPPPEEGTKQPPDASPAHQIPTPAGPSAPALPPAPIPAPASLPAGGYRTDDESTMQATKHAKWAISALNFEDTNTAVKELRLALQSLGAT